MSDNTKLSKNPSLALNSFNKAITENEKLKLNIIGILDNYLLELKDNDFVLSDMYEKNNYQNKLEFINKPSFKESSYGNVIHFKNNQSYKCNPALHYSDLVAIMCWIKLPLESNEKQHALIGDSTQKFKPIVIEKDQNKFGCLLNNQFYDSKIRFGELKIGWHHLSVIIEKENDISTIKYYINGFRPDDLKYSGIITNLNVSNILRYNRYCNIIL